MSKNVMQWFNNTPAVAATSGKVDEKESRISPSSRVTPATTTTPKKSTMSTNSATFAKPSPPTLSNKVVDASLCFPSSVPLDATILCLTPSDITSLCDKTRRGLTSGPDTVMRHLNSVYSVGNNNNGVSSNTIMTSTDAAVAAGKEGSANRGESRGRSSSPSPGSAAFAGSTFDRVEPSTNALKGPPSSWLKK